MAAAAPPIAQAEFDLTRREKVFTIVGTLLGMFLAALDQTIVGTAGPAMQRDLHIAPMLYPWITTAYLVASTVMVPIYGKLSDLFGRKPILLLGIGIFLFGSLACGFSNSTFTLIAARAIQGMGSAALFTTAFAVVADIFAPAERGKYQGIFGGAFALSSVIGPFLGGFLTDTLSWHWVFFVNLPLGAIAITFIVAKMPMLKRHRDARPRIDWAGAFFLLMAVVPFLVALSLPRGSGSTRGILLGVSLVGAISFVVVESRAREPLLDLRLFKNNIFAIGNLSTFILGAGFLGAIVFLPLFMVNVVGLSATAAGLTMTPLTFGIVAGNIGSGQIVARLGKYKPLMIIGNLVLLLGFAILAFTLRPDSTMGEVTLKMVILGLGMGPSIPLYTLAVQNSVQPRDIGVATASVTFFRQIGSTLGVTALGAAFALTLVAGLTAIHPASALAGVDPPVTKNVAAERAMPVQMHVDVPAWRVQVEKAYSDPSQRAAALAAVDELDRETKRAVTDATKAIYRWGLFLALGGLLCSLFIPQIPLRKAAAKVP
jgi:EmrB/QacA subfamily drug resistance transporter